MRRQPVKLALLLLLYGSALFAEQSPPALTQVVDSSLEKPSPEGESAKSTALPATPPAQLTVETINTEKAGQGTEGQTVPTVKNAPPPPGKCCANNGELKDPTLMNKSFRDALSQVTKNKGGTVANGQVSAAPDLPKIALLASIWGGSKDKSSAMLRINDKTEMVYTGDKISFLDKDQVIDIQVLDIQKHYVKIMMLTTNTIIVLR
ncbi:MAG: hypothetical protein WCP96_18125 [Methylococcaceae bacterium]